jgi:hypothetical protein
MLHPTPLTLAVPVNDAPTAQGMAYSTPEDTPLTKDAANGVLAGANDPDSDALTASVFKPPANGSLSLAANGSFTYTPAPDFNGADSFEFLVTDILGAFAVGKASIAVGKPRARLAGQLNCAVPACTGLWACSLCTWAFTLTPTLTLTVTCTPALAPSPISLLLSLRSFLPSCCKRRPCWPGRRRPLHHEQERRPHLHPSHLGSPVQGS